MQPEGRRCWVFVLGDFGRSPRMQYHTESLLTRGLAVTVIAYPGSAPLQSISSHPQFTFAPIPRIPSWLDIFPAALYLMLKAVFQFLQLLIMMLFSLPQPDFMLVQMPPAIPTVFLCLLVKWLRGVRVWMDWHNFAYTLMQLNPRTPSGLIAMAKWIEAKGGRCGDGHFCVSRAMQQRLKKWRIDANVVYDCPHERYQPATPQQTHQLMQKLKSELMTPMHSSDFIAGEIRDLPEGHCLLTEAAENGGVQWRTSRPAVLVSSTSWTPDEDFSLLLSALELYDQQRAEAASDEAALKLHPPLLVFITGRGPLRDAYLEQTKHKLFSHVALRCIWLEAADYPVLLGSADLGISLHTSSSGVDLPMKVVDMFGCGLPVCSIYYPTIEELIQPELFGKFFHSPEELCTTLWTLLEGLSNRQTSGASRLRRMREALCAREHVRWDANWSETVWPRLLP